MHSIFLDTAYTIALANRRDQYHRRAVHLAENVAQENALVVTTRAILIEIGNSLAVPALRHTATGYIERLERDPFVEIVPLSESLFRRGFELYRSRSDKAWGLTDCISFVVMRERGITDALTADAHFEQAGFRALLQEA